MLVFLRINSWTFVVFDIYIYIYIYIYINDVSDSLKSEHKVFADETSLFSEIHDINQDLEKIVNLAFK